MVEVRPESSVAATSSSVCAGSGSLRYRSEERGLDALGDGQSVRQRLAPGELVGAQGAGQLDQAERVAAGGGEQLGAHLGGDRCVHVLADDVASRGLVDAGDREHGQVAGVEALALLLADREQHRDGVALEPAGGEQQRGRGGVVEPVRIVDDDEHGLVLCGLREQAQRGQEHQVTFAHVATAFAERGSQGFCLRDRHLLEVVHAPGVAAGAGRRTARVPRTRRLGCGPRPGPRCPGSGPRAAPTSRRPVAPAAPAPHRRRTEPVRRALEALPAPSPCHATWPPR